MSTEQFSDLVAYHAFVKSTLSNGGSIDEDATPAAFLEYQDQLNRLRAALQPAAERFQHGQEGLAVDIHQLVDGVLKGESHQDDAP